MCLYEFLRDTEVMGVAQAESQGKEFYCFSDGHPLSERLCVAMRHRISVPCYSWNWLPSTRKFDTPLTSPLDKTASDFAVKEEYARRFMILFMPFRAHEDLMLDESYTKRLQAVLDVDGITEDMIRIANNIQNIGNLLESTMLHNEFPTKTEVPDDEHVPDRDAQDGPCDVENLMKHLQQIMVPPSAPQSLTEESTSFTPQCVASRKGSSDTEAGFENLKDVFENPDDIGTGANQNKEKAPSQTRFVAQTSRLNHLVMQTFATENDNPPPRPTDPDEEVNELEQKWIPDATGSWESIVAWGRVAGLDSGQQTAFEILAATFVLTFLEEANEDCAKSEELKRQQDKLERLARKARIGQMNKLCMFVTGPAGAGKCKLIENKFDESGSLFLTIPVLQTALLLSTLKAYAKKFSSHVGYPFTRGTIVLSAYTGAAATEIGGDTTCREFRIKEELGFASIEDIDNFKDMRLAVVDEVSFLDHDRDLKRLSKHLQMFTECYDHTYGKFPIVFLGDFRQLFPVMGTSILEFPDSPYWKGSINCVVELNGTHRYRKCPQLKKAMPDLHGKGMSDGTREMFNSRVVGTVDKNGNKVTLPDIAKTRVATFHNLPRAENNEMVMKTYLEKNHANCTPQNIPKTAIVIKSRLEWKSKQALSPTFRKILFEHCNDSHFRNSRKQMCDPFLKLIEGCPVMGTENTAVADGVANGTCALFRRAVFVPGKSAYPIKLHGHWVYAIDIEDVDHLVMEWTDGAFKGCFKVRAKTGTYNAAFPIWDENGKIDRIKQSIRITYFPIVINYATTGHKLQGKSLDELVIAEWSTMENWAYVVLSRVRTLNGIYLMKPIPLHIDFTPSPQYKEMMRFCKTKMTNQEDIADLLAEFSFPCHSSDV